MAPAIGSVRFNVYGALLLVNSVVLALCGHINHFQKFFYMADTFPFVLSIVTALFVSTMIFLDIGVHNAFTARPPFELSWLVVFGALWLATNVFSTNRWRYVDRALCASIPNESSYTSYRIWCNELQALRALIWVEWAILFLAFAFLLRWAVSQHMSGRKDVWKTSFSRFSSEQLNYSRTRDNVNSEFLQWEKFPSSTPVHAKFASGPFYTTT